MYVMMCTRPYICYAVGLASRFLSNMGIKHWMEMKRILRYLKGTTDYVMCYQGRDLRLIVIQMLIGGGDLDQPKSMSGYAFLLNDCTISWGSKKESCISLSTMEVEYVACSSAIQEAIWLRRFLQGIGVVKTASEPVTAWLHWLMLRIRNIMGRPNISRLNIISSEI